ncbi:MAG: DUF3089 domain-containing protein [Spirochaetia bacterium]|nr:DUF3089 domain-containing protein [Spirochaetia bacterium]
MKSYHMHSRIYLLIFFLIVCLLMSQGCSSLSRTDPGALSDADDPDYGEQESWLLLPDDPDAYAVDVFYAYPTVYQGEGVQDISDPAQRSAAMVPVRTQASVFSGSANLYVPMYRQLGKAGFSQVETFEENLLIGEEDLRQALLYYLAHHNDGRPFFIAGHSQGSSTLVSLLRKIWGSTGAEDRMIAAYLIGFSITQDDMEANPSIRMSSSPHDTGCFIAYNSIRDGVQDQSVQVLEGSVVTNPLSWVSSAVDGDYVDASENLGAVFFTEEGDESMRYDHFTSAQVKGQALVCEISDQSPLSSYPIEGIYHPDDYSLFYENLRMNVAERSARFLAQDRD